MSLFRTNTNSVIGIDLGVSGVKLVELEKKAGRFELLTYGFTEAPADKAIIDFADIKTSGAVIAKLLKESGAKSRRAVSALPVNLVFTTVTSVHETKPKELQKAIRDQAQKLIPFSIDEAVLEWKVLKPGEVLLIAARKTDVERYGAVLKAAGLTLASLETESLALIRSLVGRDQAPVLILDVGSSRTNITLVKGGVPLLTRSIDVGGRSLTDLIAKKMNLPLEEAEQFKMDLRGIDASSTDGMFAEIETLLKPVTEEIRYAIDSYLTQLDHPTIEKIILTGGSAQFPTLPDMFTNALNIRTYLGDPWARVVTPEYVREVLKEIGARFSVAVGLAMRDGV